MKPRVFVSRPLLPAVIERIAEHCEVTVNPEDVALKPGALAEACRDVDGLVACGVRVDEERQGAGKAVTNVDSTTVVRASNLKKLFDPLESGSRIATAHAQG